jgi:hypothetical protein
MKYKYKYVYFFGNNHALRAMYLDVMVDRCGVNTGRSIL